MGEKSKLQFDTPVQYLKGVGPHFAKILGTRGIKTVEDLLEWYPRAYEDRRAARSISTLRPGEIVSLTATVVKVSSQPLGRSQRRIYDVMVRDATGFVACKFFRVPYKGYFERFQPGQSVRVVGKVTLYRGRIEFHHPDLRSDDPDEELADCLVPIYTETEGLSLTKLRKLMVFALHELNGQIPDNIPGSIRARYKLLSRYEALKQLHQPGQDAGSEFLHFKSEAHRRVIFEEFFWLELLLASRRSEFRQTTAPAIVAEEEKLSKIISVLPYELTGAQKRVLGEVLEDLKERHPMHRLVQGDVGSGKTVVALLACAAAGFAGYQSTIMVPTEILAEQHYKNAQKILEGTGLRVAILVGSQTAKEKREISERLAAGEVDIVIGTHALIQDTVSFQQLGLVVVDEQHRFGVEQRQQLKQKGVSPHFLIMTATPIPRTLAMTVYGDLDVSVVDEMPPGRTPIVTRVVYSSKEQAVHGFIRDHVMKGRQAYVIYPLVEESEKIDLKNAVEEHGKLQKIFPEFKVGLLHGRMKGDEKDEIMRQFRDGSIQILVSTTVIEVGVDVPNANIILIEHAERFGLSQLHQLRGRVGRGAHKSYCILKLGYAVSEESRERAEIMARTTNGFEIAEADLEMRGPGEFLGARQSGLPGFKLANLVRDADILAQAREAAFEVIKREPQLKPPANIRFLAP